MESRLELQEAIKSSGSMSVQWICAESLVFSLYSSTASYWPLVGETAGDPAWIHVSEPQTQSWHPSKWFSFLSRAHSNLMHSSSPSHRVTRVRLHTVTKAWINFNSASDRSSSTPQNIQNRLLTWRRAGSLWNESLLRWKLFVVSELFAFSALWYSEQKRIKGWTDLSQLPSAWNVADYSLIPKIPGEMVSLRKVPELQNCVHNPEIIKFNWR